MTEPELLTTAQAAVRLRCSPRTVTRMAEDGRLTPAMKLPGETGAYLFEPAEIERAERGAEAQTPAAT